MVTVSDVFRRFLNDFLREEAGDNLSAVGRRIGVHRQHVEDILSGDGGRHVNLRHLDNFLKNSEGMTTSELLEALYRLSRAMETEINVAKVKLPPGKVRGAVNQAIAGKLFAKVTAAEKENRKKQGPKPTPQQDEEATRRPSRDS